MQRTATVAFADRQRVVTQMRHKVRVHEMDWESFGFPSSEEGNRCHDKLLGGGTESVISEADGEAKLRRPT